MFTVTRHAKPVQRAAAVGFSVFSVKRPHARAVPEEGEGEGAHLEVGSHDDLSAHELLGRVVPAGRQRVCTDPRPGLVSQAHATARAGEGGEVAKKWGARAATAPCCRAHSSSFLLPGGLLGEPRADGARARGVAHVNLLHLRRRFAQETAN